MTRRDESDHPSGLANRSLAGGSVSDRLDPATVPLDGTAVVEASAGTGKTHAITDLHLRLVVERDLSVDRILVVTYTNAATEELRERIRDRLAAALDETTGGFVSGGLLARLTERAGGVETARRRIEAALRAMDEAAIFTIHGFCQRVLEETAFESAMPFDTELLTDESSLLRQIAEDFWRTRFANVSPMLAGYVVAKNLGPAILLGAVRPLIGRPYVSYDRPDPPAAPLASLEEAYQASFEAVRRAWRRDRDAVVVLLETARDLSRSAYNLKWIRVWAAQLDAVLADDLPSLQLPERIDKFTTEQVRVGTRTNGTPPAHPFFGKCQDLVDANRRLREGYAAFFRLARVDLLEYARTEMSERKRRLRVQSYDDLLSNLAGAIARDSSRRLVDAIRRRWPAALIDEFQDTDPIQYRIFRDVYGDSGLPVLLVGDPKQAIYSFRGADVFAYLAARAGAARQWRLDLNWRSDPGLIRAVNAFFAPPRSFLLDGIPFFPTEPAERERAELRVEGDPSEPFRLWLLRRPDRGAKAGKKKASKPALIEKGPAGQRAADATADEIARLLALADAGKASLGDRALGGGDIAVLVRTNRQAQIVRQSLHARGVPSVQHGTESVFATREAVELERVLHAISAPGDRSAFRAALATEMLGISGDEIHAMRQPLGEARWEEHAERMHAWHRRWRDRGFSRLFGELLTAAGVHQRLLAYSDGERRMTNLLHLGELLAAAEARGRLGIEALLRWFADRRTAAESEEERDEERQLRLESDANLVQIVTVHKAKGLQYEIIFCPFLWDGGLRTVSSAAQGQPFLFHERGSCEPRADLGSRSEAEHRLLAAEEEQAELLRLLYVAVTRAKQRCTLVWGPIKEAGTSAPAWLLHRPSDASANLTPNDVGSRFATISDDDFAADVERLVERSGGSVRVDDIDENAAPRRYAAPRSASVTLGAREPVPAVPTGFRIASFSALIAEQELESHPVEGVEKDHDAHRIAPPPELASAPRTIFAFPRGVRPGRALHEVFEALDFSTLDVAGPGDPGGAPSASEMGGPGEAGGARDLARSVVAEIVQKKLAAHQIPGEWGDVATEAVLRAVRLPLDRSGEIRLAGLAAPQCFRELEFTYPVTGLDAARLRKVLLEHEPAGGRFAAEASQLSFSAIEGFMKGFVDLVFEAGGRFYIVDYKSNHLGDRGDDYAPERIAASMAREGYFLQYLIYTVALHRFLRLRVPGYDPDRHLGGTFYVFLRGLDPTREPGWAVFADRPSAALVTALDEALGGRSPETAR